MSEPHTICILTNLMLMQMHRFVVHGITRRRKHPSPWVPCEYIFGHKDLKICKDWFGRLILCINNEGVRPKNLMVDMMHFFSSPLDHHSTSADMLWIVEISSSHYLSAIEINRQHIIGICSSIMWKR